MIDFAKALYTDQGFYESMYRGLTKDGILVSQVGESGSIVDPTDLYSQDHYRSDFLEGLGKVGFASARIYEQVRAREVIYFSLK